MSRVNKVLREISEFDTYEKTKVFEFTINVLINSVEKV